MEALERATWRPLGGDAGWGQVVASLPVVPAG